MKKLFSAFKKVNVLLLAIMVCIQVYSYYKGIYFLSFLIGLASFVFSFVFLFINYSLSKTIGMHEKIVHDKNIEMDNVRIKLKEESQLRAQLFDNIQEWFVGNLEKRIDPREFVQNPEVCKVVESLNHLIDNVDAYVRESSLAASALGEERFYRKMAIKGLVGTYKQGAIRINAGFQKAEKQSLRLKELAGQMSTHVGTSVDESVNSTTRIQDASQHLVAIAQNVLQKAIEMTDNSKSVDTSTSSVVIASKQLVDSIHTISSQMHSVEVISQNALQATQNAQNVIYELHQASDKINQITSFIGSIANKTDLLALNASIEASRSGEAGKGFSVVADEVKKLSSATVEATENINSQIFSIQNAVERSVEAMLAVRKTIDEMNQTASRISSAVQEQSSATHDIFNNIQDIAGRTKIILDDALNVCETASNSLNAAKNVEDLSINVQAQVQNIKGSIAPVIASININNHA